MKIPRIYTGGDGRSHFEEIDLPVASRGLGSEQSAPMRVKNAVFLSSTLEANKAIGRMHPASKRLLVVKLSGEIEITVGDGSKRVFGPGHIHILDDTHGEGHRGRHLTEEGATLMLELED